jgi:phage tail-like protein
MDPDDYYNAYRFKVLLAGEQIGGFSEVSGLTVETEVEPLRQGGMNDSEVLLPGPMKYPARLVLKRGVAEMAQLWNWYIDSQGGIFVRQQITITMSQEDGSDGLSWVVRDACPVKWSGPELRASTSTVAVESLEFIHRGFAMSEDDE